MPFCCVLKYFSAIKCFGTFVTRKFETYRCHTQKCVLSTRHTHAYLRTYAHTLSHKQTRTNTRAQAQAHAHKYYRIILLTIFSLFRSAFEHMVAKLIERTMDPCKRALTDAGLNVADITDVVLVGGMTRMPKVVDAVRRLFKREPYKGVNPDEVKI